MAEAAATYLIEKTDNWLTREWTLSDKVKEGIERLQTDLPMTKAILKDMDTEREQDNQTQELIHLFRGVIYDIEDVLDMRAYQNSHQNSPWYDRGSRMGKHSIAAFINETEANLKRITDKRADYQNRRSSHPASIPSYQQAEIATEDTPGDEIVGVEEPKEEMTSWILDSERACKVKFVVGMGGSGKTALVKLVYDQLKTDFDCHVWLTASKSMNSPELLSIMLNKLRNEAAQYPTNSSQALEDLVNMLKNYLQDKRYLIIIDDLRTTKVWNDVRCALPRGNCSRVIITTRRGDIASSSCRENFVEVYNIQALPLEKARDLFQRKCGALPSEPRRRSWFENLLRKCEGLPIGIIEIGKLLYAKEKSESEFRKVHDTLRAELASGQLSSIRRALLLSYDDLPDRLKCCFLYMSMFPECYLVKRRTLIRLWIAEGFVGRENDKQVEDIGEEYLQELIQRNLIQAGELDFAGRPQTCRLHSLMHKIALSKSEAENFCTIWLNAKGKIPDKTRRLSIQNTEFNMPNKNLCHARTLFTSSIGLKIASHIGSSLKLLKTLHLDGASVDTFPKGIEDLLLLKYLCLSNTRIKMVPVSIGRLQHLETLNLKQTFVTSVPDTLTNLTELRHLLICRYSINGYVSFGAVNGFKVPTEVRKLTNLQKLSFVRADSDHKMIHELRYLTELRKLGIIDLPSNSGPILCKVIQILTNLQSLNMTSLHREEVLHIQGIDNPPPLQRLYLKGQLEKMPQWISKLHDLVRIRLKWSRLRQDNNPITILGKLPNLLELQLLDAYTGVQLDFEAETFLKLKVLEFDQMKELTVITIENWALPCLQKLIISRCQNLGRIPLGVENVAQLKELHLGDMPPHFVDPIRRNGQMRRLVQRIQKISYKHLQNGHQWPPEDLS